MPVAGDDIEGQVRQVIDYLHKTIEDRFSGPAGQAQSVQRVLDHASQYLDVDELREFAELLRRFLGAPDEPQFRVYVYGIDSRDDFRRLQDRIRTGWFDP